MIKHKFTMKSNLFYSLLLLFILSSSVNAQGVEGTYECTVPNRVRNTVTIKEKNVYEETEYRMREGKWVLKCTYKGSWSVSGDTLITKPKEVLWASDGDKTTCRPQDDNKQPMCCFCQKFSYDKNSIWMFGPLSKTQYIYARTK